MYRTILVPLDRSTADETILAHIRGLAGLMKSRLVLVHVAVGHVAQNQEALNLADSQEMRDARGYLERRRDELADEGFDAVCELGRGDAAAAILDAARRVGADLIAMATHGHRLLADMVLGSVATALRHKTDIPVLLVRARKG